MRRRNLIPNGRIFIVAVTASATGCNTEPATARNSGCEPEVLLAPVPTEWTTPPSLRSPLDALRTFQRHLAAAGLEPGAQLPPYRYESLVDTRGRVVQATVSPPTGNQTMDQAIVQAAREIEYLPAYNDSSPVCIWIALPGPVKIP